MSIAGIGKQFYTLFGGRMQCRSTHRSPSHDYLTIWKRQEIDYLQEMGPAGKNMCRCPKLLDQILQIESAMKMQGLIPFLHAMPASSKVLLRFSQTISLRPEDVPYRFFTPLRTQGARFHISLEEAVKKIPVLGQRRPQANLLSVSYALTSGIKHLESAASWGFVNHRGNEQNASMLHLFQSVLESDSALPKIAKNFFERRAWRLIRRYGRLFVGDFYVLGVPKEKLSRYVYDSLPYNIPTGKDIYSVSQKPSKHLDSLLAEKTHMATLVLCDETLDPSGGLVVVHANDAEEARSYCSQFDLTPMDQVPLYQEMLRPTDSAFEQEQTEKREILDRELDELIDNFAKLRLGERVDISSAPFDEDHRNIDFPVAEF